MAKCNIKYSQVFDFDFPEYASFILTPLDANRYAYEKVYPYFLFKNELYITGNIFMDYTPNKTGFKREDLLCEEPK